MNEAELHLRNGQVNALVGWLGDVAYEYKDLWKLWDHEPELVALNGFIEYAVAKLMQTGDMKHRIEIQRQADAAL